MPENNKPISFTNFHKQLPAPFVIFADSEYITVPTNVKHGNNTKAYQGHKACGYWYKVVCHYDDNYGKLATIYRWPDAVYKLIENVLKEEKDLHRIMKKE